jgi:transcriptional regulator with XRE-family HTH domain
MDNKVLGEKIREVIKKAGLTQEEFAKKINTSRVMVNKWISGDSNMSLSSLKKIAQAVGKPLEFFFINNDNENNDAAFVEIELLKKEVEILKTKIENINLKIEMLSKMQK